MPPERRTTERITSVRLTLPTIASSPLRCGGARPRLIYRVQVPVAAAALPRGKRQVLTHRQVRKDAPPLRHQTDAGARDAVPRDARNVARVEDAAARARRRKTDDAADRRRLARAVATQQANPLSRLDAQRDALQDITVAVVRVNVVDLQASLDRHDRRDFYVRQLLVDRIDAVNRVARRRQRARRESFDFDQDDENQRHVEWQHRAAARRVNEHCNDEQYQQDVDQAETDHEVSFHARGASSTPR